MKDVSLKYTGKDGGRYNTRYERDAADTRFKQQEHILKAQIEHNKLLAEMVKNEKNYTKNSSAEALGNVLAYNYNYITNEDNIILSEGDITLAKICAYILWLTITTIICVVIYIITSIKPGPIEASTEFMYNLFGYGFFAGIILGMRKSIKISHQKNVKEFYNKNKR